jgi:GDPmannose 4,6-dehydratase
VGRDKRALVTGVTGQDGSYLAELLLSKGYEVYGLVRRASTFNRSRIEHLYRDIHENPPFRLLYGDLTDGTSLSNLIRAIHPDEIYNLGAQSHVQVSFDLPEYTSDVGALGTTRILESLRQCEGSMRLYQASSSEMFGSAAPPQSEDTPFEPRSPYACSKTYSYWMTKNYREGYGLWVSNGILFNHESPRRGPTFVTRKIAAGVAAIVAKRQRHLYLGNLGAKRDWGFAPEYVEAMWKILQLKTPDDFVIGTGECHSVDEFVEMAFSYAGLERDRFVKTDQHYLRPIDVGVLQADSRKARENLGWDPKVKFEALVKIMVDAELRAIGMSPIGEGDALLEKYFPRKWWNDTGHVSFSMGRGYY